MGGGAGEGAGLDAATGAGVFVSRAEADGAEGWIEG